MEVKLFEVRDRATCMSVMAVKLQPEHPLHWTFDREAKILRHAGFNPFGPPQCYLFTKLHDGKSEWDSYKWMDRTCQTAHQHIEKKWDSLKSGDIIDVRVVLEEESIPAETDLL